MYSSIIRNKKKKNPLNWITRAIYAERIWTNKTYRQTIIERIYERFSNVVHNSHMNYEWHELSLSSSFRAPSRLPCSNSLAIDRVSCPYYIAWLDLFRFPPLVLGQQADSIGQPHPFVATAMPANSVQHIHAQSQYVVHWSTHNHPNTYEETAADTHSMRYII